MTSDWIDISAPLSNGMVRWPGDAGFSSSRDMDMASGDVCNVTRLTLSAHTGTHMDAPLHFIADGRPIDTMPLDATVGRARVIAIDDPESIKPAALERHDLQRGQRVLFRTRNSDRIWVDREFMTDFVHVSAAGARHLVERGVRTVGVDYLSVGGYERDGVETHRVLLGAGVWVIEGLDLSEVDPGEYELVCLPLKLRGVEGAPARAMLRAL